MIGGQEPFNCQAFQTGLDKYFAAHLLPSGRNKANAFLRFLKSPMNREGVSLIQNDTTNAAGNRLKVRMRTDTPLCLQLAKQLWRCDDGYTRYTATPIEHEFVLDETPYSLSDGSGKPLVFTWDFNEWKSLCINQPEFFNKKIAQGLVQLDELINRDLMGQIQANVGGQMTPNGNVGQGGARGIPLFFTNPQNPALPAINPFVGTNMRESYNLSRISGKYAVLGGTRFWNYATMNGVSSAAEWGYDASKAKIDYDFFYDLDADPLFGERTWFTLPYGGIQLVQWSANVGNGAIDYPQSKKFTVISPNGLTVDVFWQHKTDNMCNVIEVGMSCYAELAVVPAGDCADRRDINGLFRFEDNCGVSTEVRC